MIPSLPPLSLSLAVAAVAAVMLIPLFASPQVARLPSLSVRAGSPIIAHPRFAHARPALRYGTDGPTPLPPHRCFTDNNCIFNASRPYCIGLQTFQRVAALAMCKPGRFQSSSCRCKSIPLCSSSKMCNPGYRCVRSRLLRGKATCMHCNYRNALSPDIAAEYFDPVETDEKLDKPNCTPTPTPSQSDENGQALSARVHDGYTMDRCMDGFGPCIQPRLCVLWNNSNYECTKDQGQDDRRTCTCSLPPVPPTESKQHSVGQPTCTSSDDCLPGDRCVQVVKGSRENMHTKCVSCSYYSASINMISLDSGDYNCDKALLLSPTPVATAPPTKNDNRRPSSTSSQDGRDAIATPDVEDTDDDLVNNEEDTGDESADASDPPDDEVCVAADALAHLPVSQLVYGAQHRRASVLCDMHGSCATPGHMVTLYGRPMTMRTYCDTAAIRASGATRGCVRRVMLVNSVRMGGSRRIRVTSRTSGMQFTALAARYGTAMEERVLAGLIRLGV